jgi:hypothetical protein
MDGWVARGMGGWVGCEVWVDRWLERELNQRIYKDEVFKGGVRV